MQQHKDIDRSKTARTARYREYIALKLLPYRKKEQEGRFIWLRKQKILDDKYAENRG